MYPKILKYIFRKDVANRHFLELFCRELDLFYEIAGFTNIVEENYVELPQSYPIIIQGNTIENIRTNSKKGALLAEWLSVVISKEIEKKKLGTEVLGLYREVNMIYNFCEQISEKIDESSIADSALDEAMEIIDATHGLFLIYDSEEDIVKEVSSRGENPEKDNNIDTFQDLLKKFIHMGRASIVSNNEIGSNPAVSHLQSLMFAPLRVKDRFLGILMVGHDEKPEFTAAELKLLTTIALQSASALDSALLYQKGLREAQMREDAIRQMNEISQKFVPFEFIKSLGKNTLQEVRLGDQVERKVTVLFADIRNFTSISEKMEPSENFLFINTFNKKMGPIIRENKGFIMQYLGDGFMAIFPESSQDALNASIQMNQALAQLNNNGLQNKIADIRIGVGMQTGKLIMGITGDGQRLDAAIISDTVNTASRIEGLSKVYGTTILLTGACYHQIKNKKEYQFRYLGLVKVKGKEKPLKIYECINGDVPELRAAKSNSIADFNLGIDNYYKKEFGMAVVHFQKILESNPKDKTAKLFFNKSISLLQNSLLEDKQKVESAYLSE